MWKVKPKASIIKNKTKQKNNHHYHHHGDEALLKISQNSYILEDNPCTIMHMGPLRAP